PYKRNTHEMKRREAGYRIRSIAPFTDWVAQEPLLAAVFKATLLNVPLAFDPSVVMAAIHTTTIRANMTAYSTAVGPSSSRRKRAVLEIHVFITRLLFPVTR